MTKTLLDGTQIKSGSIPTTALGGGVVSSSAQAITWTVATASLATTASYALNATSTALPAGVISSSTQVNYPQLQNIPVGIVSSSLQINTGSFSGSITSASFATTASYTFPTFIDNFITVGLVGSDTDFTSIKTAVDSITDATAANTYTVRVYPGVYIENTITLKPYIAIKGDSSISTIVSASNPSASIFVMADQTMVIDMQIQGSTAPNVSAVVYSSPTTPQTNAIAYVENVRFGTNYTNAKVIGSGSSGNCILQCSNIKYGGFTEGNKSFDVGFQVTSGSDGGIGRMQLRNVTSTNGGVAGSSQDQIFALADAPGCTFIVNGCLLTRATGTATGTGFKVYNGGQLRLTAVNFQRWTKGIWAPQTGSAPSIDAIALNFENCTTDVDIQHTGSLGKVSGTDTFLKTLIAKDAPLYEVNQDPRRITVAKKGGDFTSISASVAYITDSAENNRYVIEVGPGEFTEKQIDMRGKPYIAILGSDIQTTVIIPSGSGAFDQLILGPTNEVSFLTLKGNNVAGYSALSAPDIGQIVSSDFTQVHKISIYNYDYGVKVSANTANSTFYGEYLDINGSFSYGVYVSSSNNFSSLANIENYYLFPSNSSGIGNYAVGPSSSVSLYTGLFKGDNTAGSTAIKIEQGASLEAAGLDIQKWDYGVRVPAASPAPEFRIVGSMIHNSNIYDFDVLNSSTRGRFQGVSNHSKINNNSQDFCWNFLDDVDGENDVTRKLSVTFADGTHTDATTLIFKSSPMGVMEGGVITTGSGFNITVASGFGYVQDALDATVYKRIDWVNGNLTLTANSNNYIYLTSAEVLTAAGSIPNNETNIILGRVVTNNTTIELIDQTPYNGEHMSNKLSTFNREALGPVYAAGSTVTEDSTPFKLDVTAGTYFFSENKFTPVGTSSINLTQYYPSASTWARYTSSVVPSNQYASSSMLVAMSSSAYTKHTVYGVGEGVDEKYFLVINSNQYASLVAAENANLPSIPSYFNDGVVPLAAVYVQSGSANITQIQDIRPIIGFRAAGVNASSVHGNLLGLSADDHTQYLLVNGTRAMSGNLSLGGSNITNVGTMFGTASWANNAVNAITASAADSITFIPATASFATTASYVAGLVLSSSFATTASAANSITFIPATASFATSASYAPTILPTGVVSSSVQINTGSFTGSFAGTLIGTSSWAQNAVSSSFSTTSSFSTSASYAPTILPSGVVSSATQINTGSFSGSFTGALIGTSSWASNATSASYAPTILPVGIVSSSVQINTGSFTGSFTGTLFGTSSWASNAVSSSYINPTGLPLGTVSSSVQINTGSFTGSFRGTFIGTSSWASNAISSSYAPTILPTGTISSSTQVDYNSIQNQPTTIPTASYVLNAISASFAATASYVNILNQTISASGDIIAHTNLKSLYSVGDEGGEIQLAKPETNSTIVGGVTIDVNTNKLRIFESDFPNRGGYWDITTLTAGIGTNLVGTGTVTSIAAGDGLTGGTITGTGTITIDTGSAHFLDGVKKELNTENVVSSSAQINTGSFTGSFTGTLFGTSSWANNAISASVATSASAATSITFIPATASFATTASAATSITFTPATASFATSASYALSASYAPSTTGVTSITVGNGLTGGTITSTGTIAIDTGSVHFLDGVKKELNTENVVSSSAQINTGSFTGSFVGLFTGSLFGTASWANNAISSSFATTSSAASSITFTPATASFSISSSFATSASYAPFILPSGLVSSSTQINTGSFTGSFVGVFTGSVFGTSSVATSASFATTASYALGSVAFPYVGAAVISGSLTVTGSTGINVTGPVTITGALQAQTKSFKIDHQILLGKKLIYGVLEGPEHGVYVRGRLTRNTIIHLPEEWKWLVDPISITVQLTPIGTQQVLYVQNIENNTVIINSNTPIDCFYFVQATRKDVAPLTTVE